MSIVLSIGFCVEFAMIIWLSKTVLRHNNEVFNTKFEMQSLKRKVNGYEESVEVLSKSVRILNGMVKDLDHKKEESGIDTQALVSGWDADEPDLLQQLIPKEEAMRIIEANLNCQRIEPFPQQCINPWQPWQTGQLQSCAMYRQTGQLQSSAMLPPQQCILPWQQTPTGAILPLWYVNRRLEDM